MSDTSIEWTDKTWNPVAGCNIETAGCTNCYAMRMAARLEAMGVEKYNGLTRKSGNRRVWTGKIFCDEKSLLSPIKWKKSQNIFVNSMSDLFHPDVPFKFIDRVWDTMEKTPQHSYQILTKRPNIMANYLDQKDSKILPNVWLGTSIESMEVIHRLDEIRNVPAVIRFISFEPLIGSVGNCDLSGIHWAIIGGESGPNSREIKEEWVSEIEQQCRRDKVAFFFKQWGGKNKKITGRKYKGQLWNEYPQPSLS